MPPLHDFGKARRQQRCGVVDRRPLRVHDARSGRDGIALDDLRVLDARASFDAQKKDFLNEIMGRDTGSLSIDPTFSLSMVRSMIKRHDPRSVHLDQTRLGGPMTSKYENVVRGGCASASAAGRSRRFESASLASLSRACLSFFRLDAAVEPTRPCHHVGRRDRGSPLPSARPPPWPISPASEGSLVRGREAERARQSKTVATISNAKPISSTARLWAP